MSAFENTQELAKRVRIHALKMTNSGGGSHIASCMSIADILSVLYGKILNIDPKNPDWEKRDRFILSKGHAGGALYATLAECGFFSTSLLGGHYKNGSNLSGHVSHIGVSGVEISTGSLGHGLSIATGMAYSAKLRNEPHYIYCLMSDGECDEGSIWEAVLFASHHKLSQLVAIIDYNKIQSLGPVETTLALEPFADKWKAFGWDIVEVNGHDHFEIESKIYSIREKKGQPTVVIAHTTKGKGVSFMENSVLWHYRIPKDEEFEAALCELEAK